MRKLSLFTMPVTALATFGAGAAQAANKRILQLFILLLLSCFLITILTGCPPPPPPTFALSIRAPAIICSATATRPTCPAGTPLRDRAVIVAAPTAPGGSTVTFTITAGTDGVITSVIRHIPGPPRILGGLTQTQTLTGGAASATIGATVDGDDDVITVTLNVAGGGSDSKNYATIVS